MSFQSQHCTPISPPPPSAPPPPYNEPPPAYDAIVRPTAVSSHQEVQQVDVRNSIRNYGEVINGLSNTLSTKLNIYKRSLIYLNGTHRDLSRELEAWREHLVEEIDKVYVQQKQQLDNSYSVEKLRLKKSNDKVKATIEKSGTLMDTAKHLTKTGNYKDIVDLEKKMADNIDSLNVMLEPWELNKLNTNADRWSFIKPSLYPDSFTFLLGKLEIPEVLYSMSDDIGEAVGCSTDSTVSSTPEDSPSKKSSSDGAAASENIVAGLEAVQLEKKYILLHTFNSKTFKDKARCHPMSFTLDWMENIIVPDKYNQKIKFFTKRGQLMQEITSPYLRAPSAVAMTSEGYIAVSDSQTQDIKVFSTQGEMLFYYQGAMTPMGITFNHKGELIVADVGMKAVLIYDARDREKPRAILRNVMQPTFSVQQYPMGCPHYVAVNKTGDIYVSDRTSNCLHVLNAEGEPIKRFGEPNALVKVFNEPYAVAVDDNNTVLVADYGHNAIITIGPDNEFKPPVLGKKHDLKFPTCVVYASDGKLMVSEYLSGIVKVFGTQEMVDQAAEEREEFPPAYDTVRAPAPPPPTAVAPSLPAPYYCYNTGSTV